MSANDLISGYTAYTSAEELAVEPTGVAPEATTTVTTSSQACISGISAISAVSVDNTFDHGC